MCSAASRSKANADAGFKYAVDVGRGAGAGIGVAPIKKGNTVVYCPFSLFVPVLSGAGEESRTLDLNLGKVALYQLSYSRNASLLVYTGIKVF